MELFARPPIYTCARCGDDLGGTVLRANKLCTACVRRLGERALQRLVPARRTLAVLFIACAVVGAAGVLSGILQLDLLERIPRGEFTQAEAELNDLREQVLGLAATAIYVATCVAFCVWFRRSHLFVTTDGRSMEFGPNAWGWFFAPIANLFKPYQAVKELWVSAAHGERDHLPAIFPAWWGTWIIYNLTSQIVARATWKESTELPDLISMTHMQILDSIIGMVAAVTALLMMREVDRTLRLEALDTPGA